MMKPSEFQTTIENQFDYICKVAMEDERKDYLKALSRQCKRETLFCDMDDLKCYNKVVTEVANKI